MFHSEQLSCLLSVPTLLVAYMQRNEHFCAFVFSFWEGLFFNRIRWNLPLTAKKDLKTANCKSFVSLQPQGGATGSVQWCQLDCPIKATRKKTWICLHALNRKIRVNGSGFLKKKQKTGTALKLQKNIAIVLQLYFNNFSPNYDSCLCCWQHKL